MIAILVIILLMLFFIDVRLCRLNSKPTIEIVAKHYDDFKAAQYGMKSYAYAGWDVVSHSVSPDGGWYVVYKKIER